MKKHLLPILRSFDPNDLYAQCIVHRRVADEIAVFLAWVAPTRRGTRGIDYLLTRTVREKQVEEAELFDLANDELKEGLQVDATAREDGGTYFALRRPGGFAASAIGLPDFCDQASEWTGTKRVFVGIPNPDTLLVAAYTSPVVQSLLRWVDTSCYAGAIDLEPASYLLNGSVIERLGTSKRRAGRT
jgi:hypothetical protein